MASKRIGGAGRYLLDAIEERDGICLIDGVEDYVLFDCPGQVELFTHHTSLRNIFFRIQKMGYRVGPPAPLILDKLAKCIADLGNS